MNRQISSGQPGSVVPAQARGSPHRRKGFSRILRRFARRKLALFGLVTAIVMVLVAVLGPWLMPYDPLQPNPANILKGPSQAHLFGTDNLGRDILSRVIGGARASLQVAVAAVLAALLTGVAVGVLSGYVGGWLDEVVMRVMDTLWAFPTLILALAIAAALGPSLANAMIAIAVVNVPGFARIARGQVIAVKAREYVQAARAIGAQDLRVVLRHILPNASAPMIIHATLIIGQAIIVEASLSFLGLGIQPPNPSWGSMLRAGYTQIEYAPWTSLFPGMAIFLTVLAFNLVGDGLRDMLDVRH